MNAQETTSGVHCVWGLKLKTSNSMCKRMREKSSLLLDSTWSELFQKGGYTDICCAKGHVGFHRWQYFQLFFSPCLCFPCKKPTSRVLLTYSFVICTAAEYEILQCRLKQNLPKRNWLHFSRDQKGWGWIPCRGEMGES